MGEAHRPGLPVSSGGGGGEGTRHPWLWGLTALVLSCRGVAGLGRGGPAEGAASHWPRQRACRATGLRVCVDGPAQSPGLSATSMRGQHILDSTPPHPSPVARQVLSPGEEGSRFPCLGFRFPPVGWPGLL